MDFGYSTFFAATKIAWDRESDTLYVTACHRVKEETPTQHAATLCACGWAAALAAGGRQGRAARCGSSRRTNNHLVQSCSTAFDGENIIYATVACRTMTSF